MLVTRGWVWCVVTGFLSRLGCRSGGLAVSCLGHLDAVLHLGYSLSRPVFLRLFLPGSNGTSPPRRPNVKRITARYMTKYERARVLGTRAQQISMGAPVMVELVGETDPLMIAQKVRAVALLSAWFAGPLWVFLRLCMCACTPGLVVVGPCWGATRGRRFDADAAREGLLVCIAPLFPLCVSVAGTPCLGVLCNCFWLGGMASTGAATKEDPHYYPALSPRRQL